MIRIITAETYKHLLSREVEARKVAGLEEELLDTTDQLDTYKSQHTADMQRLTELTDEANALRYDLAAEKDKLAEAERAKGAIAAEYRQMLANPASELRGTLAVTFIKEMVAMAKEKGHGDASYIDLLDALIVQPAAEAQSAKSTAPDWVASQQQYRVALDQV
ncbi:hypothetical protein [Kitasatospora sp. NPDC002965]|uniref:hypothetical protein n=1 Tax=Kitasatospora sp. NPDC002965 TaxID=3154775 RepID=UPI0033A8F66D